MTTQKRKLTLRLISERLQQLPLLPAAVTELMLMDEESPEFYDKVTELAMSDPGLATRVLQTVNSAANAPISPITDIHQALIHIGLDKTLEFISLLSVAKVFTPVTATQKSIWQHSIETAHFAEFIATQMEGVELQKGLAYTSGLLHDVGRLVLFEISAKAIDKVDTTGWDSPIELPDVETEILGFTHANVGYVAAKKWGLPNIITEMIHHHHDYDLWSDPKVPPEFTQLITIVQFADFLSVLVEKNPGWREWDNERLEQEIRDFCIRDSWPYLKFPIAPLINSLPDICDECERAMRILHLDNKAVKNQ